MKKDKNQKPNPSDFTSFEEYDQAVKIYHQIVANTSGINPQELKKVSDLLEAIKSGQIKKAPNKIDLMKIEILEDLVFLQEEISRNFFWNSLPESQWIISPSIATSDMPRSWYTKNTRPYEAISFCVSLYEKIINDQANFNYQNFCDSGAYRQFGQNLYFFLWKILIDLSMPTQEIKSLKNFLGKNGIFGKKARQEILAGLDKF